MAAPALLDVEVESITREAHDIATYELRSRSPEVPLPPFTAGAHVDLHLPSGLVRSYSLSNPQTDGNRYLVTVAKDQASRGGSRFLHESVKVGDTLRISPPRNNFPLEESAAHSLFVAGGIGVTPLWGMVQRLRELGRPWTLIYCARTHLHAAFLQTLSELKDQQQMDIRFNFDGEPGGVMLDIAAVVAGAKPETHFYCCGPLPMLAAFERATASLAPERVHVEYFTPKEGPAKNGTFKVVLQRSGREAMVQEGQTILAAILDMGVDVAHSCMEGTCGECETRVISGIPDHRDVFLTKAEQASNLKIAICCSGSKSNTLVLDL
jgi:tetrachlorobenzoquinone reductase